MLHDAPRTRRKRRSPQEAQIERKLGIMAVAMVSYRERIPRHFGDNHGVWPVKFVVTAKPREAHKISDFESPVHKVVVRHMVHVRDKEAAKRLKGRLDEMLLGDSRDSKLRHGWRDVDDPDVVWDLLLAEALRTLHIEGFDEAEKERRIKRVLVRQMTGFRKRG